MEKPEAPKSHPTPHNHAPKRESALLQGLQLIAYPTAIGGGLFATDLEIRKGAYRNFAKHGVFNELQQSRDKAYDAAIEAAKSNGHGERLPDSVKVIEHEYRIGVRDWFRGHGMHSSMDYWKALTRNQKVEAFVMGSTVSGIAIGSILAITQSQKLADFFTKDAEEKQSERG